MSPRPKGNVSTARVNDVHSAPEQQKWGDDWLLLGEAVQDQGGV